MSAYLLAIDQGTMGSRAIVFNDLARPVSEHRMDLTQYYPEDGWVEQDPQEIWSQALECCRIALQKMNLSGKNIAAVGIANQRETTIMWNRKTGRPIYRAIVWEDGRTASLCRELMTHKINSQLRTKTGLFLNPYFSASKILWLLDNIPEAREQAMRGELAFGTLDTFLLWRFTKGKVHATDATNASRTLLFNIRTQDWDAEILDAFSIPASILPQVLDSAANFGNIDAEFLGEEIPITAMIGDQQAATVGQTCFNSGMVKATYGTGCFMLLNTGPLIVQSNHRLLATVAYRLEGKATYGLEGSIFSAGAIVKWLRDKLKLIVKASDTETLAMKVLSSGGVYLVPAFSGLGAPYWDPEARGALLGLTRNTGIEHIARATLESVCYQTRDLLECLKLDGIAQIETLHVDGGMAVNNWLLQFLSDMLNVKVERPAYIETTALGAMFFAGLQRGIYNSLEQISTLWQASATFTPSLPLEQCENLYNGWKKAVSRVITQEG